MKKYNYQGASLLSFTFEGNDYVVFGEGPHELPANSQVVKALILKGQLKVNTKIKKLS